MPCPRVTVVIPTWNSEKFIDGCLESIAAQSEPPAVVVVDNGSTDTTRQRTAAHDCQLLAFDRNRGFSIAVNAGISRADSAFVLMLNADAEIAFDCVARLADALEARSEDLGVQPRILQSGAHPARIYSVGQRMRRDGRAFEQGAGEQNGPRFDGETEIFGVCGAACLLRRESLLALGGYDERFFAFYEDVELNLRARTAGWTFHYVPEALVWHVGNAAWRSQFKRPTANNTRLVARHRVWTSVKYLPVRAAPRVLAVELASLAGHSAQGRFVPCALGKLEGLRRIRSFSTERRQPGRERSRVDPWLGAT